MARELLAHSHVLHIPYIDIVNFARRASHDWGEIMGQEPCLSLAKEAEHWFDKVSTLEYVAASPKLDAPMAIADERY